MAIKEVPITCSGYYKKFIETTTQEKRNIDNSIVEQVGKCNELYKEIKDNVEVYNDLHINLLDYEEFVTNKYINGKFLKDAKVLYYNKEGNNLLTTEYFNIYSLAKLQENIYILRHNSNKLEKESLLSYKEYKSIVDAFYKEVQRKLVLEGAGYAFESPIGWICINRCFKEKSKPVLDYAATKRNKERLIKEGKRIYNKEEAQWCAEHGIEYDGVDPKVYLKNEYCYEVPLINCKLENGRKYRLQITDYRGAKVRGKTNEDLLNDCQYDVNKIFALPVDMKTKLTLCLEADKGLYLNFIRNENQKPIAATTSDR